MRYFIELSYRGTQYHGWQKQPNASTVQETLEKALEMVLRQPIELVGSSRTDAGVHAEQQVAHFDILFPLDNERQVVHSLNGILPFDVAIKKIWPVFQEHHARFAATHRCYEYRIHTQKNPFLTDLSYFYRTPLNLLQMNEAAALLLQYEDFECFSKTHTDVKTFVCKIAYAYWRPTTEGFIFYIKANRFLRGMVRAIVGTLLAVGQEKLSVADFEQIILSKNRKKAAAQAPAHGLFLTEVGYENLNKYE